MSDFHEGNILKAKSVAIQGDRLIPTNTYWAPLNSEDDSGQKIDEKNQNAIAEFLNIKTANDLIEFALRRGIPSHSMEEKQFSVSLILADAAMLNWVYTLIRFLRGELHQGEPLIPSEQVIQHFAERYTEPWGNINTGYDQKIRLLSAERRLAFAAKTLNDQADKQIETDDADGETVVSFPSPAIRFARDVINSVSLNSCKHVFTMPGINEVGQLSWSICVTALVPLLYRQFFDDIKSCLLGKCPACGHTFLKARQSEIYCCKQHGKRIRTRNSRDNAREQARQAKSSRGRKRIPKDI